MKSTATNKTKKVRVIPGYHLTLGITVTMLSLIVLIPLASVMVSALKLFAYLVPDHEADRAACICDQHRMFVYCGTYKQCVRCDHCLGACKI